MPTYEYFCKKCEDQKVERLHSMSASPRIECPKCGAMMKKSVTSAPVHYKCGGFYCTDNKEG